MPHADHTLDEQQAAFRALILPHLDRLLRFAQRRAPTLRDAEDAVQDACAKAWLSFGDLRDADRVRPWLYRILRGVLSDGAGKAERRRLLADVTPITAVHEATIGSDHDALFHEVANRIDAERLERAFAQIPADFASAVALHDIDGFKYHEIAEIAGVPIGTVMSRISRGRRLLAGTLLAQGHVWGLGSVEVSPRARPVRARARIAS